MIYFNCLGSGSDGNTSILTLPFKQSLVIDAGINFRTVQRELNFEMGGIQGVIITHRHGDHAKCIKDYLEYGIPVYMPPDVKENYPQYNAIAIPERKRQKVGDFTVIPFSVPHDETPCYGYLIEADSQKILWLTDLEYCKYTFRNQAVEHIFVECNYSMEYVDEGEAKNSHVYKGHMELNSTLDFIRANATDRLQNVILSHLSAFNADGEEFTAKVSEIVPCPVYVAQNGLQIDLYGADECPF